MLNIHSLARFAADSQACGPSICGKQPVSQRGTTSQSVTKVCSAGYAATAAHLDKGLLLGPGLLPSALLLLLLGAGRG